MLFSFRQEQRPECAIVFALCAAGSHIQGFRVVFYYNLPHSQNPFHNGHVYSLFIFRISDDKDCKCCAAVCLHGFSMATVVSHTQRQRNC